MYVEKHETEGEQLMKPVSNVVYVKWTTTQVLQCVSTMVLFLADRLYLNNFKLM